MKSNAVKSNAVKSKPTTRVARPQTLGERARLKVHGSRRAVEDMARGILFRWGYLDPPGVGSPLRLSRAPLPARVAVAAFVMTMGIGYASALLQLHASHEGADGKPGLSRADVVATFHGLPGRTRLVSQAEGAMKQHFKAEGELEAVVAWAKAGAPRDKWEDVRPIFASRCVVCHGPEGEKEDVPLVSYEDVVKHTKIEPLVSTRRLIALTHIHVLSMGGLFGLLGLAFCFTSFPSRWKILAILLPFVGMTLDFSGWWLARLDARFCDMILLGGALTGTSIGILVSGTLAEVSLCPWLARKLS